MTAGTVKSAVPFPDDPMHDDPDAEPPSNSYLRSFARGLAVIRAFDADHPEMTLSEVAEVTGLTRANARRVLLTLRTLGYVELRQRSFRLTPRILDLGYAFLSSRDFGTYVQPIIEELVAAVGAPCNVAMLDGDDVIYVLRASVRRDEDIGISINIGRRFPAFSSSMGRVLLAALPDRELDDYLERADLRPFTARTVTDPGKLRDLIAEAREEGWAYVEGEHLEHSASLGAPVTDARGRVTAAMGLGWYARPEINERRRAELLPPLLEAARRASQSMRHKL